MATLVLFNKPFGVLSQFSDTQFSGKSSSKNRIRPTLAQFIDIKNVYPAGRLDRDSEGLLLLTDSGKLQHWIAGATDKRAGRKQSKYYWVQVEGVPSEQSLQRLRKGVELKDGPTLPAQVTAINEPLIDNATTGKTRLWPRNPPIRTRQHQTTRWLSIIIQEGRNRQVRRMTAAIGHPTVRLIRHRIAQWELGDLQPGQYRTVTLHMPEPR